MEKSLEMRIASGREGLTPIDIGFFIIGNLYYVMTVLCFLLYLNRRTNMTKWKKWLWRALLVFGHMFAFPIFWYLYIWRVERTHHSAR
jgi:hypothetical protein